MNDVTNYQTDMQDITAILHCHKHPSVIYEQIAALKEQTIPPRQIIIWRNDAGEYEFPDDIRLDPSIIIIDCTKNMGVWARFAAALLTNTEFICVFDYNIIPGRKWFENCLTTMKHVNGLLGTLGWIFHYNPQRYTSVEKRIGWDGPNYETREVDMVCHAYFFRRRWIPELFQMIYRYDGLFQSDESMSLSYAFQQIGIKTYVPPHPPLDYDMYGSHPEKAVQYKCEIASIWENSTDHDMMLHSYKKTGFQFINKRT
jgi:hypothetical protein